MIDRAGRVDISFNAVGIPDPKILGAPLDDLDAEQFSLPIAFYATTYFLTARLAARHMFPNKSGVIMGVTALHSRTGIPLVGGYGPAMAAAMEALTRDLSVELGPRAAICVRPGAMCSDRGPQGRADRDEQHSRTFAHDLSLIAFCDAESGVKRTEV